MRPPSSTRRDLCFSRLTSSGASDTWKVLQSSPVSFVPSTRPVRASRPSLCITSDRVRIGLNGYRTLGTNHIKHPTVTDPNVCVSVSWTIVKCATKKNLDEKLVGFASENARERCLFFLSDYRGMWARRVQRSTLVYDSSKRARARAHIILDVIKRFRSSQNWTRPSPKPMLPIERQTVRPATIRHLRHFARQSGTHKGISVLFAREPMHVNARNARRPNTHARKLEH